MAKELIATLITNGNGEAFYTYTGTGAGETTFIAESGDLESEPLVINDISEELTLTSDKNILSYVDNDTATLTATYDGDTLEGKSVVFKLGDRILDTVQTDSEGVAEYEYTSQGFGDLVFTAECGELQETYEIEDCIKYIESDSKTFSSSSMDWQVLSDLNGIGDFELTYEISATVNKGFAIAMASNTETTSSTNKVRGQVDGAGYYGTYSDIDGSQTYTLYDSQYSANTYFTVTLQCVDGHITITHNGKTHTDNRTFNLRYLMIGNWNSAKTINYRNLKVKSLPFDGSMSVSSNKDILSYADGESCTLTAALTGDNVGNRPVIFKNGDIVLDTVNTDSNGIAAYTYHSQGVGDVTIIAECINLQETYEIEDCIKYDTHTYTTQSNVILQSLPPEYECSFILRTNGSQSQNTAIMLSDISGGELYVGKTGSTTTYISLYPTNATSQAKNFPTGSLSNNSDNEFNWKYKNGEHIISDTKGNSVTLSGFTPSNLKCSATSNCTIKNIKVKPLPFEGSMSVSSNKDILSYADGDSCTLTATLTGNDITNKPVVFKNDSTVLDTVMTDSNGEAEYTYSSQGIGDVTFTIECMNLQETYSIHDDLFADSMINSIKSAWSNNGFIITSDANGTLLKYTANGQVNKLLYNINQSSFSVEFDYLTGSGSVSFGFRVENSSNNYSSYLGYYDTKYRFGANAGSEKSITTSAPSNNHMKLEITPTSHKFYIDDVLIEEVNPSNSTTNQYIGFYLSGTEQFKVKNFEIKPYNTEQEEDTPLPTILYSNDGSKTDLQRPDGGTCTTNGQHLILGDAYKKRFMLPVTLNGDWEFSFDLKSQVLFNLVVDNVEVVDGNLRNAGTVIKLVCEQGTAKMYANDTLINSNNISSSNYSIGIKPSVTSFSLDNLQVKRLGE